MKVRSLLLAASLVLMAGAAHADPWVCYGQAKMDQAKVFNPPTNTNGVEGECHGLPFTVPPHSYLKLEAFGVEGYGPNFNSACMVIAPMIGATWNGKDNAQFLHSVNTGAGGTNSTTGLNYILPPGTVLGVMLLQGCIAQPDGAVYGWFMSGTLGKVEYK